MTNTERTSITAPAAEDMCGPILSGLTANNSRCDMAGSSLVRKLGIKPGLRIVIINPPAGFIDDLGDLPEDVELATDPRSQFDYVHLFVHDGAELERFLPGALEALKDNGLFWVSYPKRSSKIQTDLSRDHGWKPLQKAGLRAVSLISINDTW